jgi:hypothetical protein
MRSVWLCSRNDVVANVGSSRRGQRPIADRAWPDIVRVAIARLLVTSAAGVIRAALRPGRGGSGRLRAPAARPGRPGWW